MIFNKRRFLSCLVVLGMSAQPLCAQDGMQTTPPPPPPPIKPEIRWEKTYEQALKSAAKRKVPVLIQFSGSNWCQNCQFLEKKLLNKPAFVKWAENEFEIIRITVSKPAILPLMRKFGVKSVPTLVIIEPNGMRVGKIRWKQGVALETTIKTIHEYLAAYKKAADARTKLKTVKGVERTKHHDSLARYYWERKEKKLAYYHSQAVLQNDPVNAQGYAAYHAARLASSCLSYDQIKQARAYGEIVIKHDPDNKAGQLEHYLMANAQFMLKHKSYKLAMKNISKLDVNSVSNKPVFYLTRGIIHIHQHNTDDAKSDFNKTLEIGKVGSEAYMAAAHILAKIQKHQKKIEEQKKKQEKYKKWHKEKQKSEDAENEDD